MANKRQGSKPSSGRDAGGFVAMPWAVLDSPAYATLSHPARSLLWEIARQFVRDNNGRLLASRAYLAKRGWKSAGVIDRAKHELLDAGFIHETVKGHRPNKASWYAITWQALDRLPGYDAGAAESYRRGAYREGAVSKNAGLSLSAGTVITFIDLSGGTGPPMSGPPRGTIRPTSRGVPVP